MIQTEIRGTSTLIYINGGGNWLTESMLTQNRTFTKKRVLLPGQTEADYQEWTDAQKTAWQNGEHPKATPNPLYAELGAVLDEMTGTWTVNGISGITDEEMAVMYNHKWVFPAPTPLDALPTIRTNLAVTSLMGMSDHAPDFSRLIRNCPKLEVIRFHNNDNYDPSPSSVQWLVQNAPALRRIVNPIALGRISTSPSMFSGSFPVLSDLRLRFLHVDLDLSLLPALSAESINYLIAQRQGTNAIAVTLHPTAFATLTDEQLANAQSKNITFISA